LAGAQEAPETAAPSRPQTTFASVVAQAVNGVARVPQLAHAQP